MNRTDNDAEGIPEIQVGSIVSGTVSLVKDNSLMVDVMGPRGVTQGVLAYSQLSDISGLHLPSRVFFLPTLSDNQTM